MDATSTGGTRFPARCRPRRARIRFLKKCARSSARRAQIRQNKLFRRIEKGRMNSGPFLSVKITATQKEATGLADHLAAGVTHPGAAIRTIAGDIRFPLRLLMRS